MPTLKQVLTEDDIRRIPVQMDLTPYVEIIESITSQEGKGGTVSLTEGEVQRTEKRRLSLAARQKSLKLTWRKSDAGELKFVIAPTDPTPTNGRRRSRKG